MADTALAILEAAKGVAGVSETERLGGVALAGYYAGYTRAMLAESFCASAIAGGPALSSDDRMKDALAVFRDAQTKATAANNTSLLTAAKLGEARAQLWLGDYAAAATAAAAVPATGFTFNAIYSNASVPQKNFVAVETYGIGEAIRWTVGDGTQKGVGYERYPYLDDFMALGIIRKRPDLQAFNSLIPVYGQTKMMLGDSPIPMATSAEAMLIRAEALLRAGNAAAAAGLLNPLRAVWNLPAMSFAGPLKADLSVLAKERARELFLTGERLTTSRRLLKDGVDLFPAAKGGTATCFPVPQSELDTNPNAKNP